MEDRHRCETNKVGGQTQVEGTGRWRTDPVGRPIKLEDRHRWKAEESRGQTQVGDL